MKFKDEIELITGVLRNHDETVNKEFPKDESKLKAFATAQYVNLFSDMQRIVSAIETANHILGNKNEALKIIVEDMNAHSEMVNEVMENSNWEHWTDKEEAHYTNVFYYDLHKTVEEIIEELEEVK